MELSEASEGGNSDSVVDVGETIDNFSDSVDASLENDSGDLQLAGGAGLSGGLVVALVGEVEGDDALGALLALDLLGGEADGRG